MDETNGAGREMGQQHGGEPTTTGGDPRSKWCRHYHGTVDQACCAAGIPFAGQERPLPCIHFTETPSRWGQCLSFSEYTSAELDEQDRVRNERLRAYLTDLLADTCPHCGKPIEHRAQVGRSVYAKPCNHRLYQGRA